MNDDEYASETDVDPSEIDGLEPLKDDALIQILVDNTEPPSILSSRRSIPSRVSSSPRASISSHQAPPSSTTSSLLSRRRGRSDAPRMYAESSVGSASPAKSSLSIGFATPRSTRSASTAAPSVDPRGDQEVILAMCDGLGEPGEVVVLDLSLAPKKIKKSLRSLRSVAEFANESITELNAANNAVATLDGVDLLPELTALCVSRNHLKRLDAPLFALVNLRMLDLSGNFISHIPRGIAALAVLETLNLAGNNLSALKEIDALAKLVNLHTCSFAGNPFCKLPTYKDYLLSKLSSIERLDDLAVSDAAREKSRRRFSEDMFSKDKCLREADRVHASEQSKLRDMQLALEAENSRLKNELHLKSKLLQNKSKAWSSATEQLIQLQQELAMMNLDRRSVTPTASQQLPTTSHAEEHDAVVEDDLVDAESNQPHELIQEHQQPRTLGMVVGAARLRSPPKAKSPRKTKALVDSACSPFPHREADSKPSTLTRSYVIIDHMAGMLSPYEPPSRTIRGAGPPVDLCDARAQGDPLPLTAFEDDNACPAYDGPIIVDSPEKRSVLRPPPISTGPDRFRDPASPLASPSSRVQRRWEKQHEQLVAQTSSTPRKSPRRSQVGGLVDPDNLARQIQALQSCKQSLVSEIAKEEQLLHELKRECAGYANQIERLDDDLRVMLAAGRTRSGQSANRQREEETIRAKLEMLRSKLHYAEDKEAEIEATIVRMTKRALDDDVQQAQVYGFAKETPTSKVELFDKEIFALTYKLQDVIVQKEEIHAEMSRLMHQLRHCDGSSRSGHSTGLSPEALLLLDQQEQVQQVAVEDQAVFIEKQHKSDECKRRLRDVHERIKVKEDLIASLVVELKDIESELAYINEMTPKTPTRNRRALSLDSHADSLLDGNEAAELSVAAMLGEDVYRRSSLKTSPTRSASPTKASSQRDNSQQSISSMVEATAADMNAQFEQKFKELFSPEVLQAIKDDIYRKLSHLLPSSPQKQVKQASTDQEQLQAAIAAALETHMTVAMQNLDKPREDSMHSSQGASAPAPPSPKRLTPAAQHAQDDDNRCWDEVDDFSPVQNARYAPLYRFVRDRVGESPLSPGTNSNARSAALQRVLKACERLEQAEAESKVDAVSFIEVDGFGEKKSSLKIALMGARDLPTAHLRTKNLDPYVAMEIVYPEHVLPPSKAQPLTLGRQSLTDVHTSHPLSQSFRSRTVKKSLYPIWDEEVTFEPIQSLKGYLHVRVLNDRKLSREQLVGEAKIPLRTLVHQRKVVESFVLRAIPGRGMSQTEAQWLSTVMRKSLGGIGTVRLQLQLTFSRVEKAKRLVDEVVTKYLSDFNHLPPFIEPIEEYETRLAQATDSSERIQSDQDSDGNCATPEMEAQEPLPTFEAWKAHHASTSEATKDLEVANEVQPSPKQTPLSTARNAALWTTPAASSGSPTATSSKNSSVKTTQQHEESIRRAAPAKPSKPTSSSTARPTISKTSSSTTAKAAMDQLRRMVKTATPATSSLPHAGAGFSILHNQSAGGRRRTMGGAPVAPMASAATATFSPECFDEYSPYHPDFQLLDPLGIDSVHGMGAGASCSGPGPGMNTLGKVRSASYSSGQHHPTRAHTDLRIFKSPGFARREPSGGFPERFIGLDNQTSERMKRMFGRIDYAT